MSDLDNKKSKGSSHSISSVKRSSESNKEGAPVKKKINLSAAARFGFKKTQDSGQSKAGVVPVTLKLGKKEEKEIKNAKLVPKSKKAAAVFNEDSDSEPEEMPPEARMRMKNVGRDTPTSAGPNSFNKGKLGFCDTQKLWELKQKDRLSDVKK